MDVGLLVAAQCDMHVVRELEAAAVEAVEAAAAVEEEAEAGAGSPAAVTAVGIGTGGGAVAGCGGGGGVPPRYPPHRLSTIVRDHRCCKARLLHYFPLEGWHYLLWHYSRCGRRAFCTTSPYSALHHHSLWHYSLWQARLLHYFPLGPPDTDVGAAGSATAAAASATEPPSQPDLSSWCGWLKRPRLLITH